MLRLKCDEHTFLPDTSHLYCLMISMYACTICNLIQYAKFNENADAVCDSRDVLLFCL